MPRIFGNIDTSLLPAVRDTLALSERITAPRLRWRPKVAPLRAYVAACESIRILADAYNRTRLTPARKGLLQKWFAWRR